MPDILDTERPVDRHVRNPAQSSATGKHHRIPFDARAPRKRCKPCGPTPCFNGAGGSFAPETCLSPRPHPAGSSSFNEAGAASPPETAALRARRINRRAGPPGPDAREIGCPVLHEPPAAARTGSWRPRLLRLPVARSGSVARRIDSCRSCYCRFTLRAARGVPPPGRPATIANRRAVIPSLWEGRPSSVLPHVHP